MEPVRPVVKGLEKHEVVFAEDQPQYQPLPAIRAPHGTILTRWRFTEDERKQIATGADLYLEILTFNRPLQPLKFYVGGEPDVEFKEDLLLRFQLAEAEKEKQ